MFEQRIGGDELRLALDHVPAYVFIKDEEGRYRYANRITLELFGRTEEELVGLRDADVFAPATVQRLRELDDRVLAGEPTKEEVVADSLDGSRRVFWEAKTPIPHADGSAQATWILGISTDITAYKHLEERLSRAAMVDALTDLPNRRSFMERLELAMARSDRTRSHGALLFLDVDGFKTVNDTFGHQTGDRLLAGIGQRVRSLVRRNDTVARLGGDEFVIVAEDLGVDQAEAEERAEVIARKVGHGVCSDYDLGSVRLAGSVSIGTVVFRGLDRSADEVLSTADARMYAVKRARR